ncbi:hypothetical protein QN277_011362 [Acacia crassicarpa]|uniref:Uncharacterized protein n=1 Tax=Acacia crassicarpa TaxID=499986 RepID=A0AAE1MYT8_9FABA|nr:hypothetical protein QN277_011362 [Acacia crassicarpa]
MEDECLLSPLNLEFYSHEEGLEELKYAILQTKLELEATIVGAKEEITRRECELMEVNVALNKAIKERDEILAQCQKLEQENLHHQLQQQIVLQTHHEEDGGLKKQNCLSSSDSEASLSSSISSGLYEYCEDVERKKKKKGLPEKGKLLKAVIEAGPLLQTLLIAGGPLPQWQHPPPLLHFIDIPPFPSSPPPPPPPPYFLP